MPNLFFANFFLIIPSLFCCSALAFFECDESVVKVHDLSKPTERVPLRVVNLSLSSFDMNKRPFCDSEGHSAIQLPGLLQVLSGQIILSHPLPPFNASALRLSLTLEQNSLWVGRICDRGRSQSAFLADDFCAFSLCSVLPDACKSLEALASKFAESDLPLDLPLSDLLPIDQPIALVPMPQFPLLEGYWKVEAEIQLEKADDPNWTKDMNDDEEKELIILTRIGTEKWHFVSMGNEKHEEF